MDGDFVFFEEEVFEMEDRFRGVDADFEGALLVAWVDLGVGGKVSGGKKRGGAGITAHGS